MGRLAEKVALITVDENGLAAAVAVAFGREQATVVVADTNEVRLMEIEQAVRETGAECLTVAMDPVNPDSCEQGIARIMAHYDRLDVLCNLAGEFPLSGPLHKIDEAEFDRMVEANIKSVLLVSRFAIPAFRQSESAGSIINLSHTAVLNGVPGTSLLAATKGGLTNMIQNMSLQGSREGFRVNCVCVGSTFVPVIPIQLEEDTQPATPAEALAPTFVYLASDDSRHMHGHTLVVDDGLHAWIEGRGMLMPDRQSLQVSAPTGEGYLADQIVLITAGGGGIARACAKLFASEGAKIVLADINGEAAEAAAAEVRAAGGEAIATSANALKADDCARIVNETVERFGKLTVLINLVGFFGGKGGGTVDQVALDEWDWMMDINLKSVFLMSKYAIPAMIRAGGGAIVNTGTLAAVVGRGGSPCYGTGKSGVLALTRAMAADYFQQRIRVNATCPSATDTAMLSGIRPPEEATQVRDQFRRGQMGLSSPAEIAPTFLFLASEQLSAKVTGHILMADNGFSMMRI